MLVIGNGESRKSIDIDQYQCDKIGCNAIHRDYRVDHLICADMRMVSEALGNSFYKRSLIYTRKDWFVRYRLESNIRMLPDLPYTGDKRWDNPFHWGSGPYSVLLGAMLTTTNTVKMIGFDLYGIDNKINNVYKDTENYKESKSKAVDPSYWIYQIAKVFECYPNIVFKIYNRENWILPNQWKKFNVTIDSISNT
jgi:hypothetical protein